MAKKPLKEEEEKVNHYDFILRQLKVLILGN
jgi:hypothetical protein